MSSSNSVQNAVNELNTVIGQFRQFDAKYSKPHGLRGFPEPTLIEAPVIETTELFMTMRGTLERLSPKGEKAYHEVSPEQRETDNPYNTQAIRRLAGALIALQKQYLAGRLKTFSEMIRADMFSDFLEMAEYFLTEDRGYKDPAAVIAGGVLEQHLKKLCDNHGGIPTTFTDAKGNVVQKKLDTLNADLAKASAYDKNESKQVTAWAGIRNDAAHGNYSAYTADQVNNMVSGIRGFLSRNPA